MFEDFDSDQEVKSKYVNVIYVRGLHAEETEVIISKEISMDPKRDAEMLYTTLTRMLPPTTLEDLVNLLAGKKLAELINSYRETTQKEAPKKKKDAS
jgi:hypothetical protein